MNNQPNKRFDFRTTNKHEVIEHLKRGGELSQFTFQRFRDDKDVFIEAIKHYENAMQFASETLRADKSLMMESVKSNGLTLKHASKQLRADKDVVLVAVRQNEKSISFASKDLKELSKDKDPVQALEAAIRLEKMQADLKPKPPSQKRGLKI